MKGWRATGDWAKVPEDRVTVSKSVFSTGLAGEGPQDGGWWELRPQRGGPVTLSSPSGSRSLPQVAGLRPCYFLVLQSPPAGKLCLESPWTLVS